MKRIIINISEPIIEVYRISDEYLKICFANKKAIDCELLKQLDNSSYYWVYLDRTNDIFDGNEIDDFRTLRTNGKWIWSADLNYYYENYWFKWPYKFINSFEIKNDTSDEVDIYEMSRKYDSTIHYILYGNKLENKELMDYNEIIVSLEKGNE